MDALLEAAAQKNVQLVVDGKSVADRFATSVPKCNAIEECLRELLAGTDLKSRMVKEGTWQVFSEPARALEEKKRAPVEPRIPVENAAGVAIAEVEITGSHIRGRPALQSRPPGLSAPAIGDSGNLEALLERGDPNLSEMGPATVLNSGDRNDASVNWTRGKAIVQRAASPRSTMLLWNGHRIALSGSDASWPDVSMFPLSAVDHVEVLTESASAIYGSDALSGVVNFIPLKNYEGAKSSLRYANTARGDMASERISHIMGRASGDASALLGFEYERQDALFASERDYMSALKAPFMVDPSQHRRSAFSTFSQTLNDQWSLEGDLLYSAREFRQDSTDNEFFTQAAGKARQLNFAAALWRELPHSWRWGVLANRASQKQSLTNRSGRLDGEGGEEPASFRTLASYNAFDIRADGPWDEEASRTARFALGAAVLAEQFDDRSRQRSVGRNLARQVVSAYGEMSVPLPRRAELSLALRYDEHQNGARVGGSSASSWNPKLSATWMLLDSLTTRAAYATAFKSPPLAQLSDRGNTVILAALPTPTGAALTNTALLFGGNPSLRAERARSLSFGFDLHPLSLPFEISLDFFRMSSRNQIAVAPVEGEMSQVLMQPDALADFINDHPSEADVQQIYDHAVVFDSNNLRSQPVHAIFDGRYANLAWTSTSGIDLKGRYGFDLGAVHTELNLAGEYLRGIQYKATAASPKVDLADTVFHPPNFHLRSRLTFTYGPFTTSVQGNYSDSYRNNLVIPARKVRPHQTWDMEFAIQGEVSIVLGVQNVLNTDPPHIDGRSNALNYDSVNADASGRLMSAQISKEW
jgi:outer membrane receptor protein involved in Fe transport